MSEEHFSPMPPIQPMDEGIRLRCQAMNEKRAFTARVQALGRITIPKILAKNLCLGKGDVVEVNVRVVGRRDDDQPL